MFEDLLKMSEDKQLTLQTRIESLAELPPFGNYINWLKWLKLVLAVILLGYTYSWIVAPDVGVIAWLNDRILSANLIFSAWAFIGSTVLINYATMKEHLPIHWNFLAVFPLLAHGIAAVVSQIAIVASIAHMSIGALALLYILFFEATMSQWAREALDNQTVRIRMLELEKEKAELQLNTSNEAIRDDVQ